MSSSALAEGLFLFIIRISFAHTTPKPQKGAKRVEEQNRRSGRGRRVKLAAVYLLAALAAACEGESLITGTSRLAHKESDRAETLREEYAKVGIEIDLSTPDVMRIRGGAIRPARVFSHGDHRIAMSMAVSALRSSGAITIEEAEAVAKSYPRFFEDLESLRVN